MRVKMTSTTTSMMTIDQVKALPLPAVYEYALQHLVTVARRRQWNRAYCKTEKVKEQQRRYYYRKNNVYHPALNPDGLHEKRFKRVHA